MAVDGDQAVHNCVEHRVDQAPEPGRAGLHQILRGEPRGDVAHDRAEAAWPAVGPRDRRDQDIGKKARSVLPHPHTDFLVTPIESRNFQLACRFPSGNILRRVQARELPPDHVVGLVTADKFGPAVPGQDMTFRVQQQQRVITDRGDERLQKP